MSEFSRGRRGSIRTAAFSSTAMGGDVFAAVPRFYSPLEYFEQTQIPYDINNKKHRFELYKWLDIFYRTHYLIPILIDIFTRFPLIGMDFKSSDSALTSFYQEQFLDRLNYEEFLVHLGRENWVFGQSFPFGHFNETLGIWEQEELVDLSLMEVRRFPIIGGEEYFIVPPKELVDLVKNKRPRPQYVLLEKNYPEMISFLVKGKNIPVSSVAMKHVAFKASPRDLYGTPILLRGLRTLMHEEKLMASQDAIAERLYSPLILAKLGVQEMGPNRQPWWPGPNEISGFRDDLDIALSSDFRLLVHHFGVDIQNVFGREQMPRLDADFDRVERRIMQLFGVNPNLLSGGNASTPYASSALQAEFLNQMLKTYQHQLKRHIIDRAKKVAEAQGHYAYEKRGDTRVPIYEEVLEYDDEGNQKIVKKHKLLIPDVTFKCLAYGTRVSTPSGIQSVETLKDGDLILAWNEKEDKVEINPVVQSIPNGLDEVYEIETQFGRKIRTTSEHPFLTSEGWVRAKDLCLKDKLRIATNYEGNGAPILSEKDAYFCGLSCGDGCFSEEKNPPAIATVEPEIIDWLQGYALGFGCKLTPGYNCQKIVRIEDTRDQSRNPVKEFLRDMNLWSHTFATKRIPPQVWESGKNSWCAFLSGYLDSDGTVSIDNKVAWDSCNRELLLDCQLMLSYLNVRSNLTMVRDKIGNWSTAWRLTVADKLSLQRLQKLLDSKLPRKRIISTTVNIFSPSRALTLQQVEEIKEIVSRRKNRLDGMSYSEIGKQYEVCPSTIWRAVHAKYDNPEKFGESPDWDIVTRIDLLEPEPTWSIAVLFNQTHITEGIVTHNTLDLRDEATQRNFLQAIKQQGVPIPDQDLAMGMDYDFPTALEKTEEELIAKTVAQQEAKVKAYEILTARGLPVPPDLLAEMQNAGIAPPSPAGTAPMGGGGGMDMGGPQGGGMGGPGGPIKPMPGMNMPVPGANPGYNAQRGNQPEQSNERNNPFQTTGPTIPAVPGQSNTLGIPGAPSPAIGPAQGQGFRHTKFYKEGQELEDIDENTEIDEIVQGLPRNQTDDKIEVVATTDNPLSLEQMLKRCAFEDWENGKKEKFIKQAKKAVSSGNSDDLAAIAEIIQEQSGLNLIDIVNSLLS